MERFTIHSDVTDVLYINSGLSFPDYFHSTIYNGCMLTYVNLYFERNFRRRNMTRYVTVSKGLVKNTMVYQQEHIL